MEDFVIIVNGSRLENFTDAKLNRTKGEMTGTLTFNMFCGYMPGAPIAVQAIAGAEVFVYVGGNLAFTGKIDRRRGTGARGVKAAPASGEGQGDASTTGSVNIGPNEYTVSITARGKTKDLIDSSHKHPTGTMLRPTTRQVVDELLKESDIDVEWLATDIQLDKVRFRDGAYISDELFRVGNENAYFVYETSDGNLRVTDDTGRTIGDSLVLGQNILTFSAEYGEDEDRSEIRVKGQRTSNESWGEEAVVNTQKTIAQSGSGRKAVVTLQHFGDGTPEALERRATFEANKRSAASKTVDIEVFGVTSSGDGWDIGKVHYVEVPPEGIFDPMECTGLSIVVDAEKTLKTVLTLSPMPAGGISGGSTGAGFSLPGLEDLMLWASSRKGLSRATTDFAVSWAGPTLVISDPLTSAFQPANQVDRLKGLAKDDGKEKPPKKLPPTFGIGKSYDNA